MKQQTAVDKLISDILKHDKSFLEFYKAEIQQAKEMEKAQKATTWNNAIDAELKNKWESFEQFHNETYKNK